MRPMRRFPVLPRLATSSCWPGAATGLEVDRTAGGLEVALALDVPHERSCTSDLFQDHRRSVHSVRVRDGDFEIVRVVLDRAGPDRIGFGARQADGERCRGVITS